MQHRPFSSSLLGFAALTFVLGLGGSAGAQVHYHGDGQPWKQRARGGPDGEVPGWFYNLGGTGVRVRLEAEAPRSLRVEYVFEGSPAAGTVRVGDRITGAGGLAFVAPHRNGYGMEVFGAEGPVLEMARAIEVCLGAEGEREGRLALSLLRAGEALEVELELGRGQGSYGASFPVDCEKSERELALLLEYLVARQGEDGSWGSPPQDTFAPLALLASHVPAHRAAAERNVRWHARTTDRGGAGDLPNWSYMAAAIVLAEYYLQSGEEWVLDELREVHDFLVAGQYMDLSQVNPRVKESHPGSWPRDARDSHGGWGHRPGFEGYGPISMLTGQGALALALIARCGIEVDPARQRAAYDFLARATGRNGYVWYEDEVAGHDDWADLGRTGAAAIACALSPFEDGRERARRHARMLGAHPESFPDTHGSPLLGMGYAALGAWTDPPSFRRLMDANRWWFVLARCADGSFHYQPNRDNAGYGADSRLAASAMAAFVLSIPRRALVVTGRPPLPAGEPGDAPEGRRGER